ncbi:MAG: DUF5717 family protein [Defluviitaleaceae bacterium]|nr:DUF5717 family protein [Defluviitaleaceae bacterium]MCL2240653.1 DUF5717 family protein [Defluviitaleaceae bacterium]
MPGMNRHIEKWEARLAHRPDGKTAVALAMRYWLCHALSGDEGGRSHLQKANHVALSALRRNDTHLPLLTLGIFIAIEAQHFDNANELLDKAMAYKSFLRTSEPAYYGELCYLYAYLEIKQKRVRSARKHWRNLADMTEISLPHQKMMLGRLFLALGEYADAYTHLSEAYAGGCRSPYLYEGLYRYYQVAPAVHSGPALLCVLYYAAARGAEIIGIAGKAGEALFAAVENDPESGEKLYHISGYYPLLKELCAQRIRHRDHSPAAYALYLAAERKQVFVKGLYAHLVQAAYENQAGKINHYPMSQFLQTAEPDMDLAVYVYHLLLTDPDLTDLLPDHTNKILQLALRCLEQGITGRQANSLYYYYWARCQSMAVTNAQLSLAESIIEGDLTRFALTASPGSAIRFVYVTDGAKRGMDVYEMPEDGPLVIEAAGEDIAYTCLGAGQRSVLNEELTIRRMVGGADKDAYRYFFDKGDRRFYLLRYLADAYLADPTPHAIPVLETLLTQKSITKPYRMRVLLTLGKIHFDAGQYAQALENYRAVDEKTPNLPQQLLQIYLHAQDHTQAAALIERKHPHIPTDFLLEAFAELLPHPHCHPQLATAAHALLSQGTALEIYDALLSLTLEHFPFSQSELVALSQELARQGKESVPALDKKILEGSLWMATLDSHAQKAFARLIHDPIAQHLIIPFIGLCTYHMLTANLRPEYETLDILEKWYMKSDPTDNILGLALSQVCLRHNLTTLRSEKIIASALANQEENGILLPAFKEHKSAQLPFIEKHHPFLYKGLPGKEVYLYYRIDPEAPFQAKAMEYLRYGMYTTCLPLFYNEEITYYFSEELPTGSITTQEATYKNTTPYLQDEAGELPDPFFAINNAIILEQMFKHDQVETLITALVKDVIPVRSNLM